MDQMEPKRTILSKLYEAYFLSNGEVDLTELRVQGGWDEKPFQQLLDRMIYDGLIRETLGLGRTHKLQQIGVEAVENASFGPRELVKSNKTARALILKTLADAFEEEGPEVFVNYFDLAQKISLNPTLVWANLEFLSLDVVEWETIDRDRPRRSPNELRTSPPEHNPRSRKFLPDYFRISPVGLAKIESYRRLSGIIAEFEEISKMQPQPRGRALQKLLARIFENQGWPQMEGVRTSNEEIDVIVLPRA